jgi:hypothetical protein
MQIVYEWLGALLPIAGIALGAWSFRFAEEGATPDGWTDFSPRFDVDQEMFEQGMRFRARWSARMLFNAGALCLTAAVPMGIAASQSATWVSLSALSAVAIVLFAMVYVVVQAVGIWKARRRDAFSIYYDKNMWQLYDETKTKDLYFRLNPMPLWSLLNRQWFSARKLPPIGEVYRVAAKTATDAPTVTA